MTQNIKQKDEKWIRGPKLKVLVPRSRWKGGVSFDKALRIAEQGRRVIASDATISNALLRTDVQIELQRRPIDDTYPCWTGTMAGYGQPGERLRTAIEYIDPNTGQRWVFPVPEQFRGMKDAILIAEHPDYTVEEDGRNMVIHAKAVDIVENFSADEGWYQADPKHGIPHGSKINVADVYGNVRYLSRIASMVGPVRRSDYKRLIGLDTMPSYRLAMIVEAPERAAPKTKISVCVPGPKVEIC